jgi:hypothetical protein
MQISKFILIRLNYFIVIVVVVEYGKQKRERKIAGNIHWISIVIVTFEKPWKCQIF